MGQNQSIACLNTSDSQRVLKELSNRFIVCAHPLYSKRQDFKLLHEKLANKKFMLSIITADQIQKKSIESRILKRLAFQNINITKLAHYIFENYETYCGKQFKIYLVFQLESATTLREQILMQGKNRPLLTQDQIIGGLQNLINGLLGVRHLRQKHGNINTHHIYYNNGKMILADPFLCPQSLQYPQKYPSPEKVKQINNQFQQCDFYQADIFSIAMCMLEIIPSVSLEAVYKRNYTINEKILRQQISKCNHYPKLKTILQSLLVNHDNLENRKKYLEIYTTKSNHLFQQLKRSSITEKTVKIHKIGNRTNNQNKKAQQNKHAFRFNPIMPIQINSLDKPQIQVNMRNLDLPKEPMQHNSLKQSFYYNAPALQPNKQQLPGGLNLKFNYNTSNEKSPIKYFDNMQSPNSIPHKIGEQPHPRIPHHLYQFHTAPYQPKTKVQPYFNPTVLSRSDSGYSVRSEVIVFEPNKNNIMDLITPRQPTRQPDIPSASRDLQYFKDIQQKLDFSYKSQKYQHYNKELTQMNGERQPIKSIGFLQNQQKQSQQESFVIQRENNQYQFANLNQNVRTSQENYNKQNNLQNSLQSLPMKVSMLVNNKIQQSVRAQGRQQVINTTFELRTPQKSFYSPPHLNNRTIPEEQSQQSINGQKPPKGEYRIQIYENGSKYQGFFYNNMRQGFGTFYYKDGGYYEGQWRSNLMNGYGKLYYDHQKIAYEGQWYADQFHGRGKVYNDNWEYIEFGSIDYTNFVNSQSFWIEYDGELSHDIKEGLGKWKFSNGEYYLGQFKEDSPHGKGTFYSLKGVIKGIWNKGKLIKELQRF